MPFMHRRRHPSSAVDYPATSILAEGASQTFQSGKAVEAFTATGSAAVTIDVASQLFIQVLEWKDLPQNPLPVQVFEVQEWEKVVEKIAALEAASGLLNELTADQMEIFEAAVKRRPFFE